MITGEDVLETLRRLGIVSEKKTEEKKIEDSGLEKREFGSGAVRDTEKGKPRMDLIPVEFLVALGSHFGAGAEKYSDRNWEKGIPPEVYEASFWRHFTKFKQGHQDEPHLIAAIWNLVCLYQTWVWFHQGEKSYEEFGDNYTAFNPVPDYLSKLGEITTTPGV